MPHKITVVDELPKRKYIKKSIYDDVIDEFIERDIPMAQIEMTKSDGVKLKGTYLSNRLRIRIKQRELTGIIASTRNNEAYFLKAE